MQQMIRQKGQHIQRESNPIRIDDLIAEMADEFAQGVEGRLKSDAWGTALSNKQHKIS